jgi:uncharacterized protein YbcI
MARELSTAIAAVTREFYGRGPRSTRTYVLDRLVFSVLLDPFTAAERALLAADRGDVVREARQTFQDLMASSFIEQVERITGRRVVAYHSQIVLEPARALEWFLLDPRAPAPEPQAPLARAQPPSGPGATGDADAAVGDADAFLAASRGAGEADGPLRAALANAVNRIMGEAGGRGATATRAHVVGDTVVCILEGAPTPVERTLADGGRGDVARRLRAAITDVARDPLAAEVGGIMGRPVLAVEAQVVFQPDALLVALVLG